MTDQYLPTNINAPRGSRSFAFTAPGPPIVLNLDDDLVVADTTGAAGGFTLADATQIPGLVVTVKATNPGTSGNPVFVGTSVAGQTIDGAAFVLLTTDEESLTVKSDGANWRVIGGGAGAGSSIALDLLFDPTGPASEPPVYFITWPEILTAVAAIPPSPAPFKPRYRLNLASGVIPGAVYSLINAEIRSAFKFGPFGVGVTFPPGTSFSIEDAHSLEGLAGTSNLPPGVPVFSWPAAIIPGTPYVELKDCVFSQPGDGPTVNEWLGFPVTSTVTLRGHCEFSQAAARIGSVGGEIVTFNCYERTIIDSAALLGPGGVALNVFSPDTEISFSQLGLAGGLDLNIGGGELDGTTEYTLGENIVFSSGGPIDFTAIGPAGEQELYYGGTNPAGATPPQTPPFTPPERGASLTRFTYLRGIGVAIPTTTAPARTFSIVVYDGFGLPVIVESFTTDVLTQFASTTFGRINFGSTGTRIRATIVPTSLGAAGDLPDGIVASVRAA